MSNDAPKISDELKQRLTQAERDYEVRVNAYNQSRMVVNQQQEAVRDAAKLLHAVRMEIAAATPVDRSAVELSNGSPVTDDYRELRPDGMQKEYLVLNETERAKGFVRPYRDEYRHLKCGKDTIMSRSIAETYARDPGFYGGTFCATCRAHFPVGPDGEFVWVEADGSDGTKVGT